MAFLLQDLHRHQTPNHFNTYASDSVNVVEQAVDEEYATVMLHEFVLFTYAFRNGDRFPFQKLCLRIDNCF